MTSGKKEKREKCHSKDAIKRKREESRITKVENPSSATRKPSLVSSVSLLSPKKKTPIPEEIEVRREKDLWTKSSLSHRKGTHQTKTITASAINPHPHPPRSAPPHSPDTRHYACLQTHSSPSARRPNRHPPHARPADRPPRPWRRSAAAARPAR